MGDPNEILLSREVVTTWYVDIQTESGGWVSILNETYRSIEEAKERLAKYKEWWPVRAEEAEFRLVQCSVQTRRTDRTDLL